MLNEPVRAVLYCRVSTEEQAERGTSLGDQARRCEAYAAERGWALVDRFVEDGVSGATTNRPALNRLLALADKQAFQVVVVTDPDRMSRDLVDGLVIERTLAASAVDVVYLIQPSMSTLERQLRGVIAEEERRKIRDRVSRGQRAVAAEGSWPGGPPPYGYRITRSGRGRARLEINPDEAAVLTAIIAGFVDDRLTTHEIASVLNERKVATPSESRRTSNRGAPRWNHRRVRETLANARCIAGTWTYGRGPSELHIDIPPIVTEARLEQVRTRLKETSTGPSAPTRRHFFLFARRVCSPCGALMYGYARPDGTGHAYRCSQGTADQGPDQCDCKPANAALLETAAWDTIVTELTDPDRLAQLAGLAANTTTTDLNSEDVATIERRIRRIEKALGTQLADLLAAGTDPAVISRATHELEDQLRTLRQHRQRVIEWTARREDRTEQLQRIRRLADSARTALLNPTNELKAQVVELLDTRVRILRTERCPTCHGKGLVARRGDPDEWTRHHTGDICPTCRRSKTIPILEISGLLPIIEHLEADPNATTVPFKLRAIS